MARKKSAAKAAPKKVAAQKAAKKTKAKSVKGKASKAKTAKAKAAHYEPPSNDNITRALEGYIPDDLEGSDKFLDIVSWNIKWFNLQDERRIGVIADVMSEINADVFILQEIEADAMQPVADLLRRSGAGFYKVAQGTTGGDQRVTILYDIEYVKATDTPMELFDDDPTVLIGSSDKKIFPRRPLHAALTVAAGDEDPFDFQLVGVHLKSQRADQNGDDGSTQRREAAKRLAHWMTNEAADDDVIIAGDWNAVSSKPEFKVIRDLEKDGLVKFESFADEHEASHFFKNGKGTRLDYIVVSAGAAAVAADGRSRVVPWSDYLKQGKAALPALIDRVSDHMPVLSRFYFSDKA